MSGKGMNGSVPWPMRSLLPILLFVAAGATPVAPAFMVGRTATTVTAGGSSNARDALLGMSKTPGILSQTPGFDPTRLRGGDLGNYLNENIDPTPRYMADLKTFPVGDIYWFQVAIRSWLGEADTTHLRRALQVADSIARHRTEPTVMVSGLGVDSQGSCPSIDYALTEQLADAMVARYPTKFRRGPTVTLVPSDMAADGCHYGKTGMQKWGAALQGMMP